MNTAGYKSYLNWKKSRSGAAYIQYNDSKQLLKAAEDVIPKKKKERRRSTTSNDKSKSKESKSTNFRKKFSKVLDKPLEKVINFQLVDEKSVNVKLSFYPEPYLIGIFREHQMVFDIEINEWVLPFLNYINLFQSLMNLGEFKLIAIPRYTIDIVFEKDKIEKLEFLNQPDNDSKSKKVTYIIDYSQDCENSPKLNDLPKNLLKSLYRFQKQGIIFGIKKFSRLLIADEMGVGKTVQAIGLSSLYQKDWPVLVICPSSLKFAWRDEITMWLSEILDKEDIQVIKHSKDVFKKNKKYYVISYDLSVRMIDKIIEKKFNYIISDEAHYLKSRQAKRTLCLTPILQRAKRCVLLTGTPILAKPMEIYSLLHILRPDKFKSFKDFGTRYCDPKILRFGVIDWSGSSNSRELNCILNRLMIRRLKKDVLNQLPPKKRQKIEISTDSKIIKRLKMMMEKSSKKFESLLGTHIELDKLGINVDDLKTEKEKENEENSDKKEKNDDEDSILNKFSKAYIMTGEAKLPGIKDYVNYLVDNSCKFLIFAHHAEVLDAIEDVIITDKIGYIRIDGKVPVEKRQELVNKFQTDEECLVAILSITACATGLTLTKASTVVFAELHFTPSIMIQAEDRAHRIGQDAGCVNIHYLVGADTLDVLLFRKLNEKQNIVSTTLDNKSKDLNVTKIKEQVGDFINMNGKQVSIDDRKNITQVVDKSNVPIMSYLSSKSQIKNKELCDNYTSKYPKSYDSKKLDELILNDNKINIEEINKENIDNKNEIIKDDIIKNMNIHETNGRRNMLEEEKKEEEEKDIENGNKKEKKKRKKKGKKKDSIKNKNINNSKEEKDENKIDVEDNKSNGNQIFEEENKNKFEEEKKEMDNINDEGEINLENDKLFEDKVILDIFDFNNL